MHYTRSLKSVLQNVYKLGIVKHFMTFPFLFISRNQITYGCGDWTTLKWYLSGQVPRAILVTVISLIPVPQ